MMVRTTEKKFLASYKIVLNAVFNGASNKLKIYNKTKLSSGTIIGTINTLQQNGLITVDVNPANRRENLIKLTKQGKIVRTALNKINEELR